MSEPSPPFAFFDLSICESQPLSAALGFLTEVPDPLTPDLPVYMLLGHCYRLAQSGTLALTDTLVRLHRMARSEYFPEPVDSTLRNLDEDFYLAHNEIHGTVAGVGQKFTDYLSRFEPYAPDISTRNA